MLGSIKIGHLGTSAIGGV